MVIDVIVIVLLAMAVFKGWSNGLVVAVFSFLSIIIGLAAAVKLSAVVAGWLGSNTSIGERWLPVLAFLLVMIGVVILVRFAARLIEKSLSLVMLGWLNRLGGMLLYSVLYITIFSVILFYAVQLHILTPESLNKSVSYPLIDGWGPRAIEWMGVILPFLKDSFEELKAFFDRAAS